MINGKDEKMTQKWKDAFNQAYLELGGLGERVLGFCDLELPKAKFPPVFWFESYRSAMSSTDASILIKP